MLFLTYLGNVRQGNACTGLEGERGQKSAGGTSFICFTMACPGIQNTIPKRGEILELEPLT